MNQIIHNIMKAIYWAKIGLRKTIVLTAIVFLFSAESCKKEEGNFNADFSYSYIDDNHVRFNNASDGEYYSMIWDFGNGEGDTTTDKKKTYDVYYSEGGDYPVSISLMDYTGNRATTTKIINITNTDLFLSFTMEIDESNPNLVKLTNTSQGSIDSFKWLYRNKEVENEIEFTAWFPFAGIYDVELVAFNNNGSQSLIQTVTIAQDDPDYVQNLTLVWSDEFEGSAVNPDYWTFETGAGGWGNNELQNYTNGDNADVVDGKLIITAKKVNDNMEPGSYTSSRINTANKQEFQYGRMEIRAKLPSGTGIWPAIWMLGGNFFNTGWPACGEIDIMEYVGYNPNTVHATIHTTSGSGGNGNGSSLSLPTCEEEYHNYGIIWNEKKISFYVDATDNIIHTYNPQVKTPENWPFDQTAFFILNVAVGGDWGGAQGIDNSIFPQSMEIDYVRVYQEPQ